MLESARAAKEEVLENHLIKPRPPNTFRPSPNHGNVKIGVRSRGTEGGASRVANKRSFHKIRVKVFASRLTTG